MSGHNEHDTDNKARRSFPVITFDYELYAHYLEDEDLTEEEKEEFLRSLWNLVVEFMSLGYEIHPLQQAQEACGKFSKTLGNPPDVKANAVKSKGSILSAKFEEAAKGISSEAAKGIQR